MSTANEDFRLPDLGEGLEEAELVEWCVHVGQHVEENDVLAKMETAKALVDVPSPREGIIAVLHGQPGEAIKVGSPLVTYRNSDNPVQESNTPVPEEREDAGSVVGQLQDAVGVGGNGKPLAAPAVRRLARDRGVDLEHVTGTGIAGRITASDVESAAKGKQPVGPVAENKVPASPINSAAPDQEAPLQPASPSRNASARHDPDDDSTRTPFRGIRRTIAEHLRHSVSHAVHFTVMDEADVTALDNLRRKLVSASNEKITLLPFVASAVCRVLAGRSGEKFRRLNSTVDDDRNEIVQHKSVHLGIATDTDSGLMVPVIRQAQRLGVLEISRLITQLAEAARDRSIPPQQLLGSTFTISNFGSIAGRFGTPIINYPEAAILAVGRARDGVVVRGGMLGVGKLLPLSLSADHRVIDGATAATALAKIIELLQSPEQLLSPMQEG
jgi:pyruvate dehydrogenase E2 component (dihydrolipoamide acetyltransferase)